MKSGKIDKAAKRAQAVCHECGEATEPAATVEQALTLLYAHGRETGHEMLAP